MADQIIRINLWSFDHRLLDSSVHSIVETAKNSGATLAGPVPIPTRIHRVTVNRAPNGDKKSREHFEIRRHKRLIDLINPPGKTIDELQSLELPAGVYVEIKLTS
jgi:small subunit ribosomal protein S10